MFAPVFLLNHENRFPYERDEQEFTNGVCQMVVMLLSLYEGLWAAPNPRLKPIDPRSEFDSIVILARNLLSDTKTLFNHFKKHFPAEGEHKLETLPVLSMNAVELANIQVSAGLARLTSDLQCYQRHFEWLKKAATLLRPMEHDIGTVHTRLERLLKRVELLMTKLNLTRPNDPVPTLPTHGTHWSVVQAGHAIIHSFHLYLDWAARVLVLIRNKL
ncbi:interleukin-11 [Python bivittatus]|uniref:Interleukin-11 n=1 Tax=Python bivittatus TaxID=176946 RepID=A0A9F2KWL5_PYTBI|nr:interleukin-11 [Python bivittatus]